jgi:hypothetical protein
MAAPVCFRAKTSVLRDAKTPPPPAMKLKARFIPISGSSLLKWFNSLYRPTGPEEIRAGLNPAVFRWAYWGVAKW